MQSLQAYAEAEDVFCPKIIRQACDQLVLHFCLPEATIAVLGVVLPVKHGLTCQHVLEEALQL